MTTETNVAAQAGDEPMFPHHPEPHTHTWSALEAEVIRKYGAACRAAGATQVSPRATADVEREGAIALLDELLILESQENIARSDGEGFTTKRFDSLTARVAQFLATTKPGA